MNDHTITFEHIDREFWELHQRKYPWRNLEPPTSRTTFEDRYAYSIKPANQRKFFSHFVNLNPEAHQ